MKVDFFYLACWRGVQACVAPADVWLYPLHATLLRMEHSAHLSTSRRKNLRCQKQSYDGAKKCCCSFVCLVLGILKRLVRYLFHLRRESFFTCPRAWNLTTNPATSPLTGDYPSRRGLPPRRSCRHRALGDREGLSERDAFRPSCHFHAWRGG